MPMTVGPDTDEAAFKADLKGVIDRMMRQRPAPKGDELEAAVREVCEKHGVKAGATLETEKLSEPLRSIIWHGAASARVRVGQDDAGAWYVSDHRWLLYIDDDQVAELRTAGAEFVDVTVPAFERLAGEPGPLTVQPSAMDALEHYGAVKIGRSAEPENRISDHVDAAACFSIRMTRRWISPVLLSVNTMEATALDRMRELCPVRRGEWFERGWDEAMSILGLLVGEAEAAS